MPIKLSKRLNEILELAATGLTDKEIASELKITPATVATHWKRLRQHFQCSSRTEIVAKVIQHDIECVQTKHNDDLHWLSKELEKLEASEQVQKELNDRLARIIRDREETLSTTLAKYEKLQTIMLKRIEELERLSSISKRFGILASTGVHGSSWRKTWVSESIENFGFKQEEVTDGSVTIFNTVKPEDISASLQEYSKAPNNSHLLCTHRFLTKDGRERHLFDMIKLNPIGPDGLGTCEMVAIDITDWLPLIRDKINRGWPNLPLDAAD